MIKQNGRLQNDLKMLHRDMSYPRRNCRGYARVSASSKNTSMNVGFGVDVFRNAWREEVLGPP